MKDAFCQNHPEREAVARCIKFNRRFCSECMESGEAECLSPDSHCKYRPQCLVWEMARARRRRGASGEDECSVADGRPR